MTNITSNGGEALRDCGKCRMKMRALNQGLTQT